MDQQKDNKQRDFFAKGHGAQERLRHDTRSGGELAIRPSENNVEQVKNAPQQARQGFGYVLRKVEKLTTALYLVTDIMSEKEPMKWKAREISVDLLSDITIAASLPVSEKMTMLRNAMKKTEKIVAFIDVAQSAHLMSEMNSSMLKKEYLALKDNLESEWSNVYEKSKSIFSESFFDVSHELPEYEERRTMIPLNLSQPGVKEVSRSFENAHPASQHPSKTIEERSSTPIAPSLPNQGAPKTSPDKSVSPTTSLHVSDNRLGSSMAGQRPMISPRVNKDEVVSKDLGPIRQTIEEKKIITPATLPQANKTQSSIYPVPGARQLSAQPPRAANPVVHDREIILPERNEIGREDRRKIVLALIKQKPSLTVKDIAKSIPHVSEKTIQRELLSMVAEEILFKKGERRWSTYSLRQQ